MEQFVNKKFIFFIFWVGRGLAPAVFEKKAITIIEALKDNDDTDC